MRHRHACYAGGENEVPISNPSEAPITPSTPGETPAKPTSANSEDSATSGSDFAQTATAAKLSGTYNGAAGYVKRKWGELTDDAQLQDAGRDQELLGKVHHLVGTLREGRERVVKRIATTRTEGQAVLRKHGGKLLDVAAEFVDDLKKVLFK